MSLLDRVILPAACSSSRYVAMASLTVEAVHSLYAALTLWKTAPVCRSRTTKPITPG
nr:hypothetical protein [Fodinicola feengrottensis]